jgi:nicotinamide riboside kinase
MKGIGCRQVCECHTRRRPNTKKERKAKRKAFHSVVTQELNQESGNNARDVILINENVVVSWLARAEQACVAVEVIINFN